MSGGIFIAGIKILVSFLILAQTSLALTLIVFCCIPLMLVVCTTLNAKVKAAFRRQRQQIGS